MKELLDDLQRGLTDLLQMGLATAGADMVRRLRELSDRAEGAGLHIGGALFSQIATFLEDRAHTMQKPTWKSRMRYSGRNTISHSAARG